MSWISFQRLRIPAKPGHHSDQAVAVVHEPVEDGIGDGAILEIGVPLIDRQLAGDERGAPIVAVVEDFQEVAHDVSGEGREAEVVKHEKVRFGELTEQCRALLHGAIAGKFLDQTRHPEATHGEVGAASGMGQCSGDQ